MLAAQVSCGVNKTSKPEAKMIERVDQSSGNAEERKVVGQWEDAEEGGGAMGRIMAMCPLPGRLIWHHHHHRHRE